MVHVGWCMLPERINRHCQIDLLVCLWTGFTLKCTKGRPCAPVKGAAHHASSRLQAAGERTLECWLRQLPALLRLELWDCMCARTPAAKPALNRTSLGRPFKSHSKYRCFHSPLPSHSFHVCTFTLTQVFLFPLLAWARHTLKVLGPCCMIFVAFSWLLRRYMAGICSSM